VVAKGLAGPGGKGPQVLLKMVPPRHVGANTKVRLRYWVKGAKAIRVTLHDATAGRDRVTVVKAPKQGKWVTEYLTYSKNAKAVGGGSFPAGNKIDSITFTASASASAQLYVDEVVLFDAGK